MDYSDQIVSGAQTAISNMVNYGYNHLMPASEASTARGASLNDHYLDQLKYLASTDDYWKEKYLNELANRDAVARSQDYDKWVRSNSYQMLVEDLRKAGLNPYLALNSVSPSSGSVIQQSSNGYNATSAKQSALNNQANNNTKLLGTILSLCGSLMSSAASNGSNLARLGLAALLFA